MHRPIGGCRMLEVNFHGVKHFTEFRLRVRVGGVWVCTQGWGMFSGLAIQVVQSRNLPLKAVQGVE